MIEIILGLVAISTVLTLIYNQKNHARSVDIYEKEIAHLRKEIKSLEVTILRLESGLDDNAFIISQDGLRYLPAGWREKLFDNDKSTNES